jgi:hypothetical protein
MYGATWNIIDYTPIAIANTRPWVIGVGAFFISHENINAILMATNSI